MRKSFDGVVQVLLEAGILTKDLLRKDVPNFVWDSAIAGGWWRLGSESRLDIFPEQIGHYWVWREDDPEAKGLFRAEIRHWEAELLDAPTPIPTIPLFHDRKSQEQPGEPSISVEMQSQGVFLSPGIVDTAGNAPPWKDLRIEFEERARDYDELAAEFGLLCPGKWALIRAASPRVERIFREIAAKAASKAALSPSDGITELWQLWLDFMWTAGWHRPEKPPASSGSVQRPRRSWAVQKRLAEEGARTLPRVFQTSADCCRDREERGETSSAGIESPVSPSGTLGVQSNNDEVLSRGALPDSTQSRKGDASLLKGKRSVTFRTAEEYLGIGERQRQKLVRDKKLQVEGQGINQRVTTESLLLYLPSENPN
jgi:hypothetical protein